MIIPPPNPWRTRNTISDAVDQARPHSADPSVNRITDAIHSRRAPTFSAAHPVTGITAASASM
jgi:hypothetical protein